MSRIIVVTGHFPVYDRGGRETGQKEFGVSHGIDEATGRNVILPTEHPAKLGARWDREVNEWVLEGEPAQ